MPIQDCERCGSAAHTTRDCPLFDKAVLRALDFASVEMRALAAHTARMEAGCLSCHSAVPGRVCPDCYVCIACEPGCDECAPLRR